jgi:hypothetical protein
MAEDQRARALRDWLAHWMPHAAGRLEPITGDASFRRYFRVSGADGSRVVMDAPPEHEDTAPFVDVAGRLVEAGVNAPHVLASEPRRGFLLLTDLGDRLYLDALDEASAPRLYDDALAALTCMQARVSSTGLPDYDAPRLHAEMELFRQWFLRAHLGIDPDPFRGELDAAFDALARAALEQPRVFVHRDFHSRNLLVTERDNPGVLDFQDAVAGPVTYDLVSLLRDCYIAWPEERVAAWIDDYRARALAAGIELPDKATLRRWFDLMGVQRHLKAIGIFARLWHRDGKPRYLADIPRTWGHVERLLPHYPELAPLARAAAALSLDERVAALERA